MKWKSTPALAVFAAAMLACGSEPDSITSTDSLPDLPPAPMRVLFVGNSLTWWNDLPDMVEQISVADPNARPLETVNTAGRLNWTIDSLRHELEGSRRDVVVLQENQYNEFREDLITQVSTWANNVRAHGALPALYMVWPVRDSLE